MHRDRTSRIGPVADPATRRIIDEAGLQTLVDALWTRGFTVLGPTVRTGAIVSGEVHAIDDLPRGWGDQQDAGQYRLRARGDGALFGFASGVAAAKPAFFPVEEVLWRGQRRGSSFTVEEPLRRDGPYAFLGLRACDLAALGIHDTVLRDRPARDDAYAARREDAFVVAVTCSDPGGTCFCVSTDTGPRPDPRRGAAYDLGMTEILDATGHRFVMEPVSDRGADLLDEIAAPAAGREDVAAADAVAVTAAARMGRQLDTAGLKDLLYASADSPVWDAVATRCLACGNCTAVCPTCFCTTVEDVTDLAGDAYERRRVWDSCFDADFTRLHGGAVRTSTKSRYRQWMTHKLGSWIDQFGMSGCVGCGRCITWCPVGIDITEEAAALRAEASGTEE